MKGELIYFVTFLLSDIFNSTVSFILLALGIIATLAVAYGVWRYNRRSGEQKAQDTTIDNLKDVASSDQLRITSLITTNKELATEKEKLTAEIERLMFELLIKARIQTKLLDDRSKLEEQVAELTLKIAALNVQVLTLNDNLKSLAGRP